MRIQKLLSRAGVASRREGEALVTKGRVRVNGVVVTTLGTQVDPEHDVVEVDGKRVRAQSARWLLLNKPTGFLTTRADARGRRTVYDLLPPEASGLRYVGRLDRDTAGLLLFTNEGDVANRLLHPSSGVEREYEAGVEGFPDKGTLRLLLEGVELEDGPARAHAVRLVARERDGAVLSVVILEGRKREVRRLLAAVEHPVRWLRRVRFGPQTLGNLSTGAWRDLEASEVARLRKRAAGASEGPPPRRRGRTGGRAPRDADKEGR